MQDTSFAIHPGNKKNVSSNTLYDIGNLLDWSINNNIYKFECSNGFVNIQFYNENTIRVTMNPYNEPSSKSTRAVIFNPVKIIGEYQEDEDYIEIKNQHLVIKISKKPFRISFYDSYNKPIVAESDKGMGYKKNGEVICHKDMNENDHFYGFGEKTSYLDKRGEKLTMWNSDVYAPHNPETDPLYQSIPFFIGLRSGKAYGIFFDNSYKSVFDMKYEKNHYSFSAEGGQIDYYMMIGHTMKEVIKQYTTLTGRMPLPPKWALGYHQSRYSYESEQEVRDLAKQFIDKEIPIDAIYLDIHYMDGYRVFTFDKNRFNKPKKMIGDLKKDGIRIVPIVDPGVKEDPEYQIYFEGVTNNYFCKYLNGDIYYGDVWPGNSAFPDFFNSKVRKWWGEKHKFYTNYGIEGIWNDMNEPAVFNEEKTMDVKVMHNNEGELHSHREMHNLYGLMMGEATYKGMKDLLAGKRPFLLTRAGYSGIQRYAAVWTGDNRSFWEHMSMSIPMMLNLGLSGVAFSGPDVGGFAHDTTGELLTRWMQLGAFSPYFRNHSALDTVRQEPWAFGQPYEDIIKKYIQLRYKWLPHFYNLFAETAKTGIPVMRPLVMEYPNDDNTYNISDQFMIGDNVVVAPVITPDTKKRVVYLPEGKWYDYWNNKIYEGSDYYLIDAPLDKLPVFIKSGSHLIHGLVKQSTDENDGEINLHIYPIQDEERIFSLYDDDGLTFAYEKDEYLEKEIKYKISNTKVEIEIKDNNNSYHPSWDKLNIHIHDIDSNYSILINKIEVEQNNLLYNSKKRIMSLSV